MQRRWATVVGVVLCLFAAAPASAAFERAPIELGAGDGNSPSVVMDPAGTAHIVWGIAEDLMGYCTLPRGARSCTQTVRLSLDARTGRPEILRRAQDGLLIVVAGRDEFDDDPDESAWTFTSTDGVTWAGPTLIGQGIGEFDAASLTADGLSIDLLESDTGINGFQRAPVGGPPVASVLNLASTPAGTTSEFDYPGDLVRMRNGRTMALLGSPADGFAYRILSGADPFADAAWSPWPAARITTQWNEPRGASGPRGTWVMYGVHILDQAYGAAPQVARRLRGTRWGRRRGLLFEVDANTSRTALAQDGKGRLHAAIVGFADSGKRSCIAYARTGKRRWFTRAVSLHQTLKDAEEPGRVRLAVDPRGRGMVSWATGATPSISRLQWLKPGRGVTRPRPASSRGCPPFPR